MDEFEDFFLKVYINLIAMCENVFWFYLQLHYFFAFFLALPLFRLSLSVQIWFLTDPILICYHGDGHSCSVCLFVSSWSYVIFTDVRWGLNFIIYFSHTHFLCMDIPIYTSSFLTKKKKKNVGLWGQDMSYKARYTLGIGLQPQC